MHPVLRTAFVFLLAASAFSLGRYSVEFSGRTAAWVSLAASVIVLAFTAGLLAFMPTQRAGG